MKLRVIIVCYNVVDLTIACLRSLAGEIGKVPGARVTVCENGSGGDAAARLESAIREHGWSAWCDFTAIHPNRGFTGGNNHVIREVMSSSDPPEYILLLNADTIVLPDALIELVSFMDAHPKIGIGGSRLETEDRRVHVSAFRFQSIASEFDRGMRLGVVSRMLKRWQVAPPPPVENSPADWVSGASMIIRQDVLRAIGPLDEGFYTYFDDIDYCLNAGRAGWSSWYVPRSRVIHLEGASTGIASSRPVLRKRRPSYWFQARRRYFVKNHGAVYAAFADAAYIIGLSMYRVRRRIQRTPEVDPPMLLWDSVRHSIFFTGFGLNVVENPAMSRSLSQPQPRVASA